VSFVLVAAALVFAGARRRLSVAAIVPVGVIAGTCLIGYLYSIPAFYGPASAAKMAVNTGFAFLVITIGVVLVRPSNRLRNALIRTDPAMVLARRLLPVAFVLPTTLGWLRLVGEDAGIYDDRVGTWLLTAATIFSLAVIVAIAALRLQQELRQAERQFTAVFNHAPVGMALVETDGSLVTANAALGRLVGSSVENLRGAPRGALGALLSELAAAPGAGRRERAFMAADGAELRVAATSSLIRTGDGGKARVVVQIEDVTRQHMMAEAVAVSRQTLQEQVARLQQLDQMKEEFVSLVTHELRTPLTSIAGYLDLLLEDEELEPLGGDRGHFAEVARRNTQRLIDLVEDLLLVRRLESGREVIEADTVDLSELLAEQVESLEPATARGDLLLTAGIEPGVTVSGDARKLAQIVDNLLSNAVKYTPPGGTVGIALQLVDGAAQLTVADSGIGIPESERGDLFTPFFRASNAHGSAVAGTGLGLVITRRLVEAHGGTIELMPEVETGTAFTVRLPALTPAAQGSGRMADLSTEVL
jgi:signal transduction histidine kinase